MEVQEDDMEVQEEAVLPFLLYIYIYIYIFFIFFLLLKSVDLIIEICISFEFGYNLIHRKILKHKQDLKMGLEGKKQKKFLIMTN